MIVIVIVMMCTSQGIDIHLLRGRVHRGVHQGLVRRQDVARRSGVPVRDVLDPRVVHVLHVQHEVLAPRVLGHDNKRRGLPDRRGARPVALVVHVHATLVTVCISSE